jgi:hypothetical protein
MAAVGQSQPSRLAQGKALPNGCPAGTLQLPLMWQFAGDHHHHHHHHHHHVTQSSHSINAIGPAPLWFAGDVTFCIVQ